MLWEIPTWFTIGRKQQLKLNAFYRSYLQFFSPKSLWYLGTYTSIVFTSETEFHFDSTKVNVFSRALHSSVYQNRKSVRSYQVKSRIRYTRPENFVETSLSCRVIYFIKVSITRPCHSWTARMTDVGIDYWPVSHRSIFETFVVFKWKTSYRVQRVS